MAIATDILIDYNNMRIYQAAPYVCREPVSGVNTTDASTDTTTLVDSALISSANDFYIGYYVHNVTRNLSALVSGYVGATKTITHATIAGQIPGDTYYLRMPAYTSKALYTYLMSVFPNQAQMDNKIPMTAQTPNAFTIINGWFIDDETIKWFKDGAIQTANWTHPTNPTGIRLLKLVDVREPASSTNTADAGTGPTTLVDAALPSAVDDFYNGYFVFNTTRSLSGKVTDYDQATKTITCESITAQAVGDSYYLLASVSQLIAADIGTAVTGGTTNSTGKLLAYNATRKVLWIRCDAADDTFANASEVVKVNTENCGNMTAASTTGENLYVNLYTLGTLTSTDDTIYILQNSEKIPAWWIAGITNCDVLVKVLELGTPIQSEGVSGKVTVFARYYPTTGNAALYDHFPITLTAGRQAVPLSTALDLNNTTAQATVAAYGITFNTGGGPYSHDLNPGESKNYSVEVLCNNKTVAQLYEFLKYATREGSSIQLFSDAGEEYISANAGYAVVKASPLGTFAGGIFFGAQGVWIQGYATADAQKFYLMDNLGETITPPNTVVCTVSSLVSGYNVGMYMTNSAGVIETTTYTLSGQHEANATTVLVTTAIAGNWSGQRPPPAGYLRVVLANGTEVLKKYTSWVTSTFTLDGTLGTQCADASKVYVPIIDEPCSGATISNSLIKAAGAVYIKVRVRHYASPPDGIIPFEQDTQISSTGINVPAIKVIDSIVN